MHRIRMFLFPNVGMFPTQYPTAWERGTTMDFRSFFKPAGTNPEVEGPYYELSSFTLIVGHSNFKALTLGFEKGSSVTKMTFRPIDPTKPIVLAVGNTASVGFIYIDHHLEEGAEAGMRNYDNYMTDDFIIDCQRGDICRDDGKYWSISSEGLTFVYGEKTFPETWTLNDCDQLCAFVAGELSANELRMHAYLIDHEAIKEARRQDHIERLTHELRKVASDASSAHHDLSRANARYERLVNKLKSAMNGIFPFIGKTSVLQVIEDNN